ncbi:hypothetical protein LPJ71_007947, partial [Coemansia sp. S17]
RMTPNTPGYLPRGLADKSRWRDTRPFRALFTTMKTARRILLVARKGTLLRKAEVMTTSVGPGA